MKYDNEKFGAALKHNAGAFGLVLNAETMARLGRFYELVERWNPRLHLVAPCAPEEFAVRHVLESLFLSRFLPADARFADVGTGAGLPALPCLIARADLSAELVESNSKKVVYLREAIAEFGLQTRAEIKNARFEQLPKSAARFVACRALDKFAEKLPEIIRWSEGAEKFLFFGGEKIRDRIRRFGLKSSEYLLPTAENRFLFVVSKPNE